MKIFFTPIKIYRNKLAMLLGLSSEFIADAAFNLESYLVKRLTKNFAQYPVYALIDKNIHNLLFIN